MNKKAVAIVSGGMDSVTMLYRLIDEGYTVRVISFNYGQRHKKELDAAALICRRLGVQHTILNLEFMQPLLTGSALTDENVSVPHGYYAEENMRLTVVPNRNMVMLSIAGAVAVASGAEIVATAVHAGDHFIYPDCRPEFIQTMTRALQLGNEGHCTDTFRIYAPYLNVTKVEIAQEGARLGVPYEDTWTCYEGGDIHCGVCGSCQERRDGFLKAGIPDPTVYKDLTIYAVPD